MTPRRWVEIQVSPDAPVLREANQQFVVGKNYRARKDHDGYLVGDVLLFASEVIVMEGQP
jgi:hypothetical protein